MIVARLSTHLQYTYAHVCAICLYACVCVCCTCKCMHACVCACVHACMRTWAYACMQMMYASSYPVHLHIHTCKYFYIHTFMQDTDTWKYIYSTTPRNGNRANGNHLDQSLRSSQKNRNSLTWVLVALTRGGVGPRCP